jgi:hypothetical protein
MSEQLRRIQFVTTYYQWLQGLRFIPLGLMCLGLAVWGSLASLEQVRLKTHPVTVLLPLVGGLTLAGVLYAVLGAYYRRRFGIVQASPATRQRMSHALSAATIVGLLAGLLVEPLRRAVVISPQVQVFIGLLLTALGIIWYWHWSGRVAKHYLYVAAGLGGWALLELLGANPVCALLQQLPFTTTSRCNLVTLSTACGASVIVMGVLDHLLLARTLGPEPEPEPGEVTE